MIALCLSFSGVSILKLAVCAIYTIQLPCKCQLIGFSAAHPPDTMAATTKGPAPAKASERRTIRISIEGNIAAGKSTFLKILSQQDMDFIVVPEPVQKWQALPADDDEQ